MTIHPDVDALIDHAREPDPRLIRHLDQCQECADLVRVITDVPRAVESSHVSVPEDVLASLRSRLEAVVPDAVVLRPSLATFVLTLVTAGPFAVLVGMASTSTLIVTVLVAGLVSLLEPRVVQDA